MKKSKRSDDTPIFVIRTNHFVANHTFAHAVASYCWLHSEVFDPRWSRRKVMSILKEMLFHYGINGVETETWSTASPNFVQPYEDARELCVEWLEKNYPYLK